MVSPEWRLLDTGVLSAASNMALEKVLLTSCANGSVKNTLHLLEFSPCVLLGYSQSLADEVDEDFCRENNIEINRRISGGGCIYMDPGVLGWEIIAKKNTPRIPGNLNEMYRLLCGALILALSRFGINATYRPVNDVEVNGRKISGAGGTELEDSFIFHGTVLADFHSDIMVKALKSPFKKNIDRQISEFKIRTTCMRELLGYVPSMTEIKANLVSAFAEILGIEFECAGLIKEENEMLNSELPLFGSEEWIRERRLGNNSINAYEHKNGSALIRVSNGGASYGK